VSLHVDLVDAPTAHPQPSSSNEPPALSPVRQGAESSSPKG
jgi:hypothetical protein